MFVDLANDYGASIDIDYAMRNFKGGHLADSIRQVEEIIRKPLPESFEVNYRKRSYEVFKNELQPIMGINNVLDSLEVPFCTASSGPMKKIIENLKRTGLYSHFEGNIFSCYDIEKWKPDPTIYLLAAKAMGFEIKDCLVIEDSENGVKSAKAADMKCVAIPNTEKRDKLFLADKIVNRYFEITDVLIQGV